MCPSAVSGAGSAIAALAALRNAEPCGPQLGPGGSKTPCSSDSPRELGFSDSPYNSDAMYVPRLEYLEAMEQFGCSG